MRKRIQASGQEDPASEPLGQASPLSPNLRNNWEQPLLSGSLRRLWRTGEVHPSRDGFVAVHGCSSPDSEPTTSLRAGAAQVAEACELEAPPPLKLWKLRLLSAVWSG